MHSHERVLVIVVIVIVVQGDMLVSAGDVLPGGSLEYCTYNTDVYSVGESWLVDDCTQCTCIEGAQMLCSITVCEITSAAQCSSSYTQQFSTACCPICHSQLFTYTQLYSPENDRRIKICTVVKLDKIIKHITKATVCGYDSDAHSYFCHTKQ